MATKGQKFNKYSYELKMEIINKYMDGEGGLTSLANEYNIPRKTIDSWIYQFIHKNNDMKDKSYLKGRKKEENIDYKERYEILKKYQAFLKAQRGKK
jgi:transposase-like protein